MSCPDFVIEINRVPPDYVIDVIEQGPPGPPGAGASIVDENTFLTPETIVASIPITTDTRFRVYVKGPATDPTIAGGTGPQEMYIVGTDDSNPVLLNGAANVILSGPIALKEGTILCLHWIEGYGWLEDHRNEVF